MSAELTVLSKIGVVFLLLGGGWLARRRGVIPGEATAVLSRLVVDVAFPALVLTQLLRTVSPDTLRHDLAAPLLGLVILLVGLAVGRAAAAALRAGARRPTFVFLAMTPNWIFLPLLIVEGLYGDAGIRTVLLYNVGAQLGLWTVGVATLRGARPSWAAAVDLLRNPGLVATACGIGLAVAFPALRTLERADAATLGPAALAGSAALQALGLLGSVTIPLSILVTGAQLGGFRARELRPDRAVGGVLLARLVLTPACVLLCGVLAAALGLSVPRTVAMVGLIIASMPVAISCSLFAERFGGDVSLAVRGVFFSTLLSALSVPALFLLWQRLA